MPNTGSGRDAVMQEAPSQVLRWPARTLRTKIALVLTATVVALLAAATFLRAVEERRALIAERTEMGVFIAQALAELIAREGGLTRPDRVRRLVADYGRTAGVVSVRVVDRTFTVVAAYRFENVGRTYRDPDVVEAVKHGVTATQVWQAGGPSILDVVVPIRADGRLVGAVEVGLDLTPGQTELRTFVQRGILVALVVAGTATLLLLWSLTLVVVRPITQYAAVSQDLARGDFDVEIPSGGADEIGQLGRALARTRDSLRELSALWKDQNPLSGLPGNLAIQRELGRSLDTGRHFVVLYADLDAFKAFNDRYGFDRGDQLLRFTAKVLAEALQASGGGEDFLGHVGGDDFVLVVGTERAEAMAADAIRRFDAGIGGFYDDEDRRRGYVATRTRQGHVQHVPLTGLSIVGVPVGGRPMNVITIGEAVAELKANAKRKSGSKFVMDHRAAVDDSFKTKRS